MGAGKIEEFHASPEEVAERWARVRAAKVLLGEHSEVTRLTPDELVLVLGDDTGGRTSHARRRARDRAERLGRTAPDIRPVLLQVTRPTPSAERAFRAWYVKTETWRFRQMFCKRYSWRGHWRARLATQAAGGA
jgi:hypothetical protein